MFFVPVFSYFFEIALFTTDYNEEYYLLNSTELYNPLRLLIKKKSFTKISI